LITSGRFKMLDVVEDEIERYEGKEDFLKNWVKKWKAKMVVPLDEETINASIPIVNAEHSTGFFNATKQAEGIEEADPYLIAYCKVNDCSLITNESKLRPNRIPAVATKNGVHCIDINEFLEERELKMERKKKL
jgi:hypothetical protein